jgi:phosphatidylserine decarboxylase
MAINLSPFNYHVSHLIIDLDLIDDETYVEHSIPHNSD